MVSYNRRMGNSVPQVIDYASPWINLAMTIEDRKRAKEDYGLKRQWEEEDRALRQKQIDENKALSAEERAYQRSRDAKQDMLAQEQRDYAAEDRLWDQKKYEDDLVFKKSDEARKAELHNIEMKIAKDMEVVNQRKSEMKSLNPEAERILGQVQETYKSLLSAVNEGNQGAVKWHTDKISELNKQYRQLTQPAVTANPFVDTSVNPGGPINLKSELDSLLNKGKSHATTTSQNTFPNVQRSRQFPLNYPDNQGFRNNIRVNR